MRAWLRASDKRGLPVPWAYIRRALAERWHCRPWDVDEAPWDEIELELQILELEAEAERARPKQ